MTKARELADLAGSSGGGIDVEAERLNQVIQSIPGAEGFDWSAGMAFDVVDAVPADIDGKVGDVVFIPGGPGGLPEPVGPAPGLVYLHHKLSTDWVDYFEWTLSPEDENKYAGYVVNLVVSPEQSENLCYRVITGDGEYTNNRYFQSDIRNDGTGTIKGSVDNDMTKGTIVRAKNASQRNINLDIHSSWTNVYGRSYGGSDLSLDTFQIRVLDAPSPNLGFRVFADTGRVKGKFGVYGYLKEA